VLIGNDVEIGANAAIDRGALDDTVIEDGVRLDNLVHLAHNVRIGQHTALAAQNGVAGSTTIGKRCMFGGQVGIDGHLKICDDVIVGGKSVLTKDIMEPGYYVGTFSAEKDKEWKRKVARFRRLEGLVSRVRILEKKADDE
jgi:UDP-3-O-[3-hydroxymyristoyl] glucosamine N-acyltransferase